MTDRPAQEFSAHLLYWGVGAICLLMFVPGLDRGFSDLFYDPSAGFMWGRAPLFSFVREAVPTIIMGTYAFFLLIWIAGLFFRQSFLGTTTPRIAFLTATLILGPAILVETVLKSYWGRARPNDTVFFGGEASFTPPLWIAQQCAHNCSFVSGHAAIGFWLSAYGFLLPPAWRLRGVVAGMICGFFIGLVRVVQGAHFLSDVIFAGAFVLLVNVLLARVILRRFEKPAT